MINLVINETVIDSFILMDAFEKTLIKHLEIFIFGGLRVFTFKLISRSLNAAGETYSFNWN